MADIPKRILIFSFAYEPLVGGAEVAVREVTDRLVLAGYEFDMVTVRPPHTRRKEHVGHITVYRVSYLSRLGKLAFPFLAALKALSLYRTRRYDATWSIMAAYAGFAGLFFKVVHPKVPFVLTLQEGDPLSHIRHLVRHIKPLFFAIFKRADRIHTISHFLAQFAKEEGAMSEPVVIGNGVDGARFSAALPVEKRVFLHSYWEVAPGDIILITASRLVLKNAVDVIIESLVFTPQNVRLVVAGEGPLLSKLQALARTRGLEPRVRFIGTLSHEDLPAALKAADIFVRPSRSEGFGNAFIEAMAAGIPVIGTAVGGIPDFLHDGETGFIVPVDDPQAIAKTVERCAGDVALREKIIRTAAAVVFERYDWNTIAARMDTEVFTPVIK